MTTKAERTAWFFKRMEELGFSYTEADKLRLIEKTLHRWSELECGDGNNYASWSIERDETTGKPYLVTHPHQGKSYRRPIADREKGALKRAKAIMANHPDLWMYHQGDPRGCTLYVGKWNDGYTTISPEALPSCYTRGIAVCI